MGTTGGALADVTGDVQLSVPSGSAAAGTVFTITPISSRAAGALGTSFRIEASRPLQGPVQVSFRGLGYYGAGLGVSALGIRFQDSRGFWLPPDAIARDAATDTVTATTTHLSDWTLVLDDPPDLREPSRSPRPSEFPSPQPARRRSTPCPSPPSPPSS